MKSLKAKFRKTDVNEWNKNDERLLAAVEHGEAEKLASLLSKKGSSAAKLDGEGKSALHVAAARGQSDCLAVLLAHGADLTVADAAGLTPLHLAARNGHVECCRKLLQSKSAVDAADVSGRTALHYAASGGNAQVVQLLCELRGPVNLKDADGLAPLLCSAKHGHADACAALLDCGADIDACDNAGRTALMLASESNALATVEVLVQRGADLSSLDSQGRDVGHYANLSGSPEIKTALNRQTSETKSPRSPQHDQVAKLSDERITTPKKRKAPPPPISPQQSSGPASPSALVSAETAPSSKNHTPKIFAYKDDEVGRAELRGEVEERSALPEVNEDLQPRVNQPHTGLKVERSLSASAALVSALQARITALTLENRQLADKLKKHPAAMADEDLKENSRPGSVTSNSSFHSTQDEFEAAACDHKEAASVGGLEGESGGQEEASLLRQALESVQLKLLETRKENRSLQSQLKPGRARDGDQQERLREKAREEALMESLAELQQKLTDTQERYQQAVEEAEELRATAGAEGGESTEKQEQELEQLRAQLGQAGRIRELEEALSRAEEEQQEQQQRVLEEKQRVEELYKEAQEEIRILQEALRGTVPVEAAAKDFEEMKAELSEVISGLQRRLLELSHSYSEAKSQLGAAQRQLAQAPPAPSEGRQLQELQAEAERLTGLLAQAERKAAAVEEEVLLLRQEAEAQAQSSVALSDHTQVMSSLGNAIKELESQAEALKEELEQKTLQVETLQDRLAAVSELAPEDAVSRAEHESAREHLAAEVSRLTRLLQGALRKQDEMALDAADAWQKAREHGARAEALQELATSREEERRALSSRLAESQDAVSQLKQLVEKHVASEREKNKRIDDLSREVGKLKEALNSLSQLSYSAGSPSKRQQQNQQLESTQAQIRQLQYQLAESEKQHHEIVSVYRMHLLYAVQGQMDEDVQKALKQILLMCKMSAEDGC